MRASHKVINSANEMVGYMVDDSFYTECYIKENIQYIDNLSIDENGIIVSTGKLQNIEYKEAVDQREYDMLIKENPFARDIQKDLEEWRNDRLHKVLQLEGSRQIGKTTELLKFAYKNYEYVIYVNLANDIYDFANVTENGCKPLELEKYCIRAQLPHFVNSNSTILIIDEIQISEKVYNSIRSLYSQLKCDIIVTGSYLGQTIKADFFLPAGTVTYIHMYPLSFLEFCRIFNKEEMLMNIDLFGKDDDLKYDELTNLYEIYKQIGGYPEVIKRYCEFNDINACYDVIEGLLKTFQKESGNYFQNSKEQKMMVSRDEISNAISWLTYSGIIGECGIYNNGDVNQYIPARRLYYMDCGIAAYVGKQSEIPQSNISGLLTETFVFSELSRLYGKVYSKRLVKGTVPCFSTLNQYELDFMVIDTNNIIYGIEVKTTDGDPKSLKVFIDKRLVDKGIVAKDTKGGHGDKFDTIPVYTVGCRFPYE